MASRTPRSDVLAGWLAGRRWFAAKTRRVAGVAVEDEIPLASGTLAVVRVALEGGGEDRYAVPLLPGDDVRVADALEDAAFCRGLLALIGSGGAAPGRRGEVRGVPASSFPRALPADTPARRLGGEQSNTSVAFGDRVVLKHFRRLAEGPNPEEEMTRFLSERAAFPHTPRLFGHLEYRAGGAVTTLAVAQELVPGARDGWEWTLEALADPSRRRSTLAVLERLGAVTGALHRALAAGDDPAFAPEPIGDADIAAWARDVRAQLAAAAAAAGDAGLAADLAIEAGLRGLAGGAKIRHHGDFHLGQTLCREATGEVFVIDFEGEPLRPLAERRRKHCPLRDVAGMLRSIDYAAATAAGGGAAAWAESWRADAAARFVGAYRAATRGAPFAPAEETAFTRAVAVFVVEKAAYEVVYEANNRPDWIAIPRRGLLSASAALGRAAAA